MIIEVWMEGYQCNGDRGTASFLGETEAETFAEACKKLVAEGKITSNLFNEKQLTVWGCRLYDNEAEARAKFG